MLHLLTTFRSMPWAVEPAVLSLMAGIIDRWSAGVKLSQDEVLAAIGDSPEVSAQRKAASIAMSSRSTAVIPVYGVLAHRAYSVQNTSRPLTSTEALANQFKAAAANPEVQNIVMDIDSPGGSVFGVEELGNVLAQIRSSGKRLVAVANNTAASGAYWIASQADEIVVTPSGMVGSIGVILPHTDTSQMHERMGVKQEFITYGQYKAEGAVDGPLTDEYRAHLQEMVNGYGVAFTRAVAKGRGIPVETVRGPAFGQGRMRMAKDAVSNGMADAIGTLEDTVARVSRSSSPLGMRAELADRDIQILEIDRL